MELISLSLQSTECQCVVNALKSSPAWKNKFCDIMVQDDYGDADEDALDRN